jgi:predicted GNAT family N-acyltransferase
MTTSEDASPRVIEVRRVTGPEDMETIYLIRHIVFVDEQRLTPDARNDPDDRRSLHYLAYLNGEAVGTGRLTMLGPEAQIAWLAVLEPQRGSGVGRALMEAMLTDAVEAGSEYVILNAQTHALEFYQRLGFRTVGDVFRMSRIPHQVMIAGLRPGGGDTIGRYLDQFGR